MKRYRCAVAQSRDWGPYMHQHPDGEFVKWEDSEAEIAAAVAREREEIVKMLEGHSQTAPMTADRSYNKGVQNGMKEALALVKARGEKKPSLREENDYIARMCKEIRDWLFQKPDEPHIYWYDTVDQDGIKRRLWSTDPPAEQEKPGKIETLDCGGFIMGLADKQIAKKLNELIDAVNEVRAWK
jgi:hypothetical protein